MTTNTEPIPGASPGEKVKPAVTPLTNTEAKLPHPFLEKYQARANELKIKPVKGGSWLVSDGVEYGQWGNETYRFPTNTDERILEGRLEQVGTYCSNNSTLAYVDEQGRMHFGHATEENYQSLERAGYRRGSIWVPFSNGEVPTDPEFRKRYVELRERGREENRQRNLREHLRIYGEVAEEKGIKPIEGGLWMMVDGIEYRYYGNETGCVDINTDSYNMAIRRLDQVGTYDSNNGRMAFVDEQGRMWVGASTDENYKSLMRAGYVRGGIWVPFSNGEIPTDRATYEQLRDILTGKRPEQLKVERITRVEEIIKGRQELFGETAVLPDKDELLVRVADRTEKQYVNREKLVEERLNPHVEKDEAGFERRVYTINGVTFAFKGREEIPIYTTLTSSRTTLLGEAPNWVETEQYQRYQEQLQATQTQEGAAEHYVVNKSLLGVVDLAIRLGSKDASLVQVRDELTKGIYSQRAITLIDALIATNYMEFSGFGNRPSSNAEAVILLSLLGDASAQTAVSEAVETMHNFEHDRKANRERRKVDYEPLKPQDLVCVHATRYRPREDGQGGFLVDTTFDATKGKVLRNTIHTALNHKVAGHMYGSWNDAGYVIISPFERMMEANGIPTVLNTVDTYWATNPGEPLRFAEGTLVVPGGKEVQGLFEEEGNIVKFKSEGLDGQDLINLADYAQRNGYLDSFSRSIDDAIGGALHPYGSAMELGEQWDFDTTHRTINQFLYQADSSYGHEPALLRLLTAEVEDEQVGSIESRLRTMIEQSGAVSGIKPEVQEREKAVTALVRTLADRIRSTIFTEINELAVREAIVKRGFTVQPGGMWAWGDSWTATGQTAALGEELGVSVGAHTNMIDHDLTERFIGAINQATEGERGAGKFNWVKYSPDFDEFIPKIDPKSRRVLYASGLLNARG